MKRLTALFLTLALAASLGLGARAAAAARLVRAFVYQDTLYTYVDSHRHGSAHHQGGGGDRRPGLSRPTGTLETVRQAGFPVTWMLLVDNSNSMPPFREEAVDFARELAAGSGENTRFLLASFGDSFSLLAEDVPADQLAEALAAIPMDETVTRLHSSIQQALDAFETIPRTGNELRGLIVLSDAVAYDPGASVSYEELLERVNGSDVMLHSVGFGTDVAALESLAALTEASGGLHQVVGEDRTAAEAAGALAEATGDSVRHRLRPLRPGAGGGAGTGLRHLHLRRRAAVPGDRGGGLLRLRRGGRAGPPGDAGPGDGIAPGVQLRRPGECPGV